MNRSTPMEQAVEDYRKGLAAIGHLVDYAVINVSSPNTPGIRTLQERPELEALCSALLEVRPHRRDGLKLPLLVKISPDLSFPELEDVLDVVVRRRAQRRRIEVTIVVLDEVANRARHGGE